MTLIYKTLFYDIHIKMPSKHHHWRCIGVKFMHELHF